MEMTIFDGLGDDVKTNDSKNKNPTIDCTPKNEQKVLEKDKEPEP